MSQGIALIKKYMPQGALRWLQPSYHFLLALIGAPIYRFPSRRLVVIGVTGTKGKTTVVELLHRVIETSGARVASLSSLRFRMGEEETRNDLKMTMPGRFFIQRFLRRALRGGCRFAVLEVTSEGIKQFRHRFIKFDAVALTNIAAEHIEAHGSFDNYVAAKRDLFRRVRKGGFAVINRDDPQADRFAASTTGQIVWYGKGGIAYGDRAWPITNVRIGDSGISFLVDGTAVSSPLLGEFNFYNLTAAAAVGLVYGIAPEKIVEALACVTVIPGRMEFVQREPFAVVVDYAHTPDSLKNVYTFLRESYSKLQAPSSKLICVLGSAGGGRDKWKRPEMGRIAAEFCDEVILTNEDPYDENPAAILEEIAAGFRQVPSSRKILDRREAIREAIKSARPGDTVVLTGKGSESWIMGPAGSKIPWNECGVVREELRGLLPNTLSERSRNILSENCVA